MISTVGAQTPGFVCVCLCFGVSNVTVLVLPVCLVSPVSPGFASIGLQTVFPCEWMIRAFYFPSEMIAVAERGAGCLVSKP